MKNILYSLSFILFSLLSCQSHKVNINFPKGGYNFPTGENSTYENYYYYPIKDLESRRDSFMDGNMDKFYQPFNEPNLSIKPSEKPIFRFTYSGWRQKPVIILLTEEYIIIKQGKSEDVFIQKENNLNEVEKSHLHLVYSYWLPMDLSMNSSTFKKHYLDSLVRLYPQLVDTKYYRYLIEKSIDTSYKFHYTTEIKPISSKDYEYLTGLINSSGYWELPPVIKCEEAIADGAGFILEANTTKKYNVVKVRQVCPNSSSKLYLACEELIKYAGLSNDITLIWRSP